MNRRRFLELAGRLSAGLGVSAPLLEPATGQSFAGDLGRKPGAAGSSQPLVTVLDQGWSIATDPGNVGRQQAWFRAPRPEAKPTRIPSILQETFPQYHGVVWYWITLEPAVNPYAAGRYLFRFHAVDYLADA
jgi:hypothetical protein